MGLCRFCIQFCHEFRPRSLRGRIASQRIAIFGNRPRNFGAVGRPGPMGGHHILIQNILGFEALDAANLAMQ